MSDPLTKEEINRLKNWCTSRQGGWVKEIGLKVLTALDRAKKAERLLHEIETDADPTGEYRKHILIRDENEQLRAALDQAQKDRDKWWDRAEKTRARLLGR